MVRCMEKTISTVSDLFAALGGTEAVVRLFNVSEQQVSNMRRANYIPPKHHFAVTRALPRGTLIDDRLYTPRIGKTG